MKVLLLKERRWVFGCFFYNILCEFTSINITIAYYNFFFNLNSDIHSDSNSDNFKKKIIFKWILIFMFFFVDMCLCGGEHCWFFNVYSRLKKKVVTKIRNYTNLFQIRLCNTSLLTKISLESYFIGIAFLVFDSHYSFTGWIFILHNENPWPIRFWGKTSQSWGRSSPKTWRWNSCYIPKTKALKSFLIFIWVYWCCCPFCLLITTQNIIKKCKSYWLLILRSVKIHPASQYFCLQNSGFPVGLCHHWSDLV